MKRLFSFFLALAVLTFALPKTPASGQALFTVGTKTDTAKPNTTKKQLSPLGETRSGYSVQYHLHHLTDSINGVVSVWYSLNGTYFLPYPGMDSVAIVAGTDLNKIWFLNNAYNGNPVRFIEVRTRCTSNSTNSTGKAKLTTELWPYK